MPVEARPMGLQLQKSITQHWANVDHCGDLICGMPSKVQFESVVGNDRCPGAVHLGHLRDKVDHRKLLRDVDVPTVHQRRECRRIRSQCPGWSPEDCPSQRPAGQQTERPVPARGPARVSCTSTIRASRMYEREASSCWFARTSKFSVAFRAVSAAMIIDTIDAHTLCARRLVARWIIHWRHRPPRRAKHR